MNREIRVIKEILKILENTIIQLTNVLKDIQEEDVDNHAYRVDLKRKKQ